MIKNITILYVEDEFQIRENTKRPLEYLCEELFVACDGKEGLKLYKKHNPDIVISDIRMPNMNGIDMCKAIKNINENQHIIFTTAHSESSYFMDAIEMQVDGYILKPIDYNLLENKIKKIIEQINLKILTKKQQEQIQQQKLDMLEQTKNVQMGEMLGNIAHQWRQPLSVISTVASGIQAKKELGVDISEEEENSLLETILSHAQSLSKTIDIFKELVNVDKKHEKIVLQDQLATTLDIVKTSLDAKKIKIINNIHNTPSISIDIITSELSQVIINIFKNAQDVLEKKKKKGWIKIDLKKEDNRAIIVIEDCGGGISKNIIDKIFDPYFTTKHKAQGTGLSLHMTKKIVEQSFRGTLSVENGKDGAIFTIILPINIAN